MAIPAQTKFATLAAYSPQGLIEGEAKEEGVQRCDDVVDALTFAWKYI